MRPPKQSYTLTLSSAAQGHTHAEGWHLTPENQTIQPMLDLALQHHRQDSLHQAEQMYLQVLAIDPHHPDALHLLGMIAYQTGRDEKALELIRRAIATKGDAASYHSNLGNILQSQGKLEEAGACYQRALVLKPDLAEVYLNLGNIFSALRNLDSSLTCYRRAKALNPNLAEAVVAEAVDLLLQGDFAAGWQGFERRWEVKGYDTPARTYPCPRWKGEKLSSGRLLLWGEQGIGDEILFAGLVPEVIRTGNRCILECDARLQPLFARSFPGVEVVARATPEKLPKPDIAAHLPTGSLPALLRASTAAFAATTSPYLKADPLAQSRFRARYADGRKSIGLAWHTKSKKTGRIRSIDLSVLTPLFTQVGVQWVSLQYGDHDTLTKQIAAAGAPILLDHEVDQLANIDAFAAQIASLDLVITIDNSTAHLAGALGVPVWLLLPFAPDWRWQLHRTDSPWYPSTRLFRQPKMGHWQAVVDEIQRELSAHGCRS